VEAQGAQALQLLRFCISLRVVYGWSRAEAFVDDVVLSSVAGKLSGALIVRGSYARSDAHSAAPICS
jgi:hypothetical protein